MDIDGFRSLLLVLRTAQSAPRGRHSGPSQFSHEISNANPYAYLDDAPLEERPARAVEMRRILPESVLEEVGKLDPAAIAQVCDEGWPDVRDPDELHDVLHSLIAFPETMWGQPPPAVQFSEAEQAEAGLAWLAPSLQSSDDTSSRASLDRTAGGGCPHVARSADEWQGYFRDCACKVGPLAPSMMERCTGWRRSGREHFQFSSPEPCLISP